jgi:hypothetical protein
MTEVHSSMAGRRRPPSAGPLFVSQSEIPLILILFGIFVGFSSQNLQAQSGYREIPVNNGGTISGTVRLSGTVPPAEQMEITKDPASCGRHKRSPRLELGKNNCVKNAVVYLEGILEGKKLDRSGTFIVNQQNCEYSPHITIVPQGAQLVITNSDPILHNVHAYDDVHSRQTAFNIAQPIRGQKTIVKQAALARCGEEISLTCDAGHPWMNGYIFTVVHPYYTVTDKDGHYKLDNIPPGMYTMVVWHEGVGVTNKEMEQGKINKYLFEESYKVVKKAIVPANGNTTEDFDLVLR